MAKVADLSDPELDRWVARALGWEHLGAIGAAREDADNKPWCLSDGNDWWRHPELHPDPMCGPCYGFPYNYSTDWSQGGPIIDQYKISVVERGLDGWAADLRGVSIVVGVTPLIAAMRALVASKFGDEVT